MAHVGGLTQAPQLYRALVVPHKHPPPVFGFLWWMTSIGPTQPKLKVLFLQKIKRLQGADLSLIIASTVGDYQQGKTEVSVPSYC